VTVVKLVIYPAIDASREAAVQEAAGDLVVINCRSSQQAVEEIADADGFFGKITPELLASAGQLHWVQSPTASLEHYLFPELIEHPCTLTNMRGLFYDVIADHVFGYILMFSRRLHVYMRQQLAGTWQPVGGEGSRQGFSQGPGQVSAMDESHIHVSDSVLGIIGVGSIGSEIARRGRAFGMRVLGVDPDPREPTDAVQECRGVDQLPWLLSESDFVVIAAPHTPETEGLFQAEQFQQMKSSAYLVNIGRGVIVRLDDLVTALEAGDIAGAALDVFETEPLPADHPLWRMENVILTPHVAACSVRIPQRHLETLLENVRRFASGQPLQNIANKQLWY
jgi:phosphoglycerate dehydrogenase-like enzyme